MSSSNSVTTTVVEESKETVDNLADKDVNSVDTEFRYMAYASRLRTAVRAASRYLAYTSDVGEAFRPVVHPLIVTAAYGISWIYVAGDVGFETYKAQRRGPTPFEAAAFSETTRLALVATQRAIFQGVASMALPAFTVHTIVRQSAKLFIKSANPRIKAWGPTMTGLAAIPVLPYLFDHPVEKATEHTFGWIERKLAEQKHGPAGAKREL